MRTGTAPLATVRWTSVEHEAGSFVDGKPPHLGGIPASPCLGRGGTGVILPFKREDMSLGLLSSFRRLLTRRSGTKEKGFGAVIHHPHRLGRLKLLISKPGSPMPDI